MEVRLSNLGRGVEGGVNHAATSEYAFKFDETLSAGSSQQRVYDVAAKDIVESVLQGVNGSIMAYGQTGAGSDQRAYSAPPTSSFCSSLAHLSRFLLLSALVLVSKTYTIVGDKQSYENRGLIPRAIGHIFRAIGERPDLAFRVAVSYIEIYNGERQNTMRAIAPCVAV